MTRLFNFTRTQERSRNGVFVCFGMEERGDLYSRSGKNMNKRSFNEGGQRIKKNREPRLYFKLWEKLVH